MDNPLANQRVIRGLEALKGLSVNLVTHLNQISFTDQSIDRALSAFARHQTKVLSSLLTGAGAAGGIWAAFTLWTSSLGIWGSMGYALGLVTAPVWIPLAGGAAGLTAAGGAVFGALHLWRSRARKHKLQAIIGFSKAMLNRDEFDQADKEAIEDLLRQQQTSAKNIEELLATTPKTAQRLADQIDATDQWEVARHLFPLVYAESGIITDQSRRCFDRICTYLDLSRDDARRISVEYRQNLDRQWTFLSALVRQVNPLADALGFDHREMETLREQLEQLAYFDPRRSSTNRRHKLLGQLGRYTEPLATIDPLYEATAVGAYTLAQSAIYKPERLDQLDRIFDQLAAVESNLSADRQQHLTGLRNKVARLFDATRRQIAIALDK